LKVISIVFLKIILERDAFCNLKQTGVNSHQNYHSGIIFRESYYPGNDCIPKFFVQSHH